MPRKRGARDGAEEGHWAIEIAGTELACHAPLTGEIFAIGARGRTRMRRPSGQTPIFHRTEMTGSASSRVVRNMFPNGTLESEYTEVDGKIEGYRRRWYP